MVLLVDEMNMSQTCNTEGKSAPGAASISTCRDTYVIIRLSACQATPGVLCLVLVLTIQERCRQIGEGQKEGNEDDEKAGECAL